MPKEPPPGHEPYGRPRDKDGKCTTTIRIDYLIYLTVDTALWSAGDMTVYYLLPLPLKHDEVVSLAGDLKLDRTKTYHWGVGSPNMDWIPMVPSGWRVLQARADGRYGEDDRTQYPIYAVDGFLFAAAMPNDVPERPLLKLT